MSKEKTKSTVQTTGHAWDGDLQEFNNPLPRWWLWGFYATVVFTIVYWVIFPAWPVGKGYTTGMMNDITYKTSDGKEVTTHWNTRALLLKDLQEAREEQAVYLDQLKTASYEDIARDEVKSAFAFSSAKVLFADNCAACHGAGGDGIIGKYPSLVDDAWLWGGSYKQIENTIRNGHNGFMPAFKSSLSEDQIDDVAEYVLSLSGEKVDAAKAAKGAKIFLGQAGGCHYCHGKDAKGMTSLGSANLTDSIWTIADVPGANSLEGKKEAIKNVIRNGVGRTMPAWKDRLSDTEIKILSFYVHELGGGK